MKYIVKEYQATFPIAKDDTYIFPAEQYYKTTTEVEWNIEFSPDDIAAIAMHQKYGSPTETIKDYLTQLEAFQYYYDEEDQIHFLNYDIDDGDNVEFITLVITEA